MTESLGLRSERVRQQLEYDKAMVKAAVMAEQMFKGHDKLHSSHMNTVSTKFTKSKKIQNEKTSRVNYRAQLAQDLRDIQLNNTYLQEEIDDQIDQISSLQIQV